jgi:capsular polysaccharide biosynthesis protein
VSGTFKKEIKDIMSVDNVSILAKAEVKENPSPLLNIAIAVVVGLMARIGLAVLLEYLDNTIRNEKDIETLLDWTLLGFIQKISQHK